VRATSLSAVRAGLGTVTNRTTAAAFEGGGRAYPAS